VFKVRAFSNLFFVGLCVLTSSPDGLFASDAGPSSAGALALEAGDLYSVASQFDRYEQEGGFEQAFVFLGRKVPAGGLPLSPVFTAAFRKVLHRTDNYYDGFVKSFFSALQTSPDFTDPSLRAWFIGFALTGIMYRAYRKRCEKFLENKLFLVQELLRGEAYKLANFGCSTIAGPLENARVAEELLRQVCALLPEVPNVVPVLPHSAEEGAKPSQVPLSWEATLERAMSRMEVLSGKADVVRLFEFLAGSGYVRLLRNPIGGQICGFMDPSFHRCFVAAAKDFAAFDDFFTVLKAKVLRSPDLNKKGFQLWFLGLALLGRKHVTKQALCLSYLNEQISRAREADRKKLKATGAIYTFWPILTLLYRSWGLLKGVDLLPNCPTTGCLRVQWKADQAVAPAADSGDEDAMLEAYDPALPLRPDFEGEASQDPPSAAGLRSSELLSSGFAFADSDDEEEEKRLPLGALKRSLEEADEASAPPLKK